MSQTPTATNFQIAIDTDFYTKVVDATDSYETSRSVTISSSYKDASLYSRVKHTSALGSSSWSPTRLFKVSSIQKWINCNNNTNSTSQFRGIASDNSQYVYAVGYLSGSSYPYIVKMAFNGTIIWKKYISSSGSYCMFYDVKVGSDGYIYAAGVQYTGGKACPLIVKWTSSGTIVWAKYLDSSTIGINIYNFTIKIDSNMNIYTCGRYYYAYPADTTQDYMFPFISKWTSDGNCSWQKVLNVTITFRRSWFDDLALDSSGNIYASGCFYTSNSGYYGFLTKWGSDGTFIWQKYLPVNNTEFLTIDIDSNNNIYVAGYYSSSFYPYIAKLDTSGNFVWQKYLASSRASYLQRLGFDKDGNIYVGGMYYQSNNYWVPYVTKWSPDGTILWQKYLGSSLSRHIYSYGFCTDTLNHLFGVGDILMYAASNDGSGSGTVPNLTSFSWVATTFTTTNLSAVLSDTGYVMTPTNIGLNIVTLDASITDDTTTYNFSTY